MKKRIVAILALGFLWVTGARGQMPPDPENKRDNPTGNTGALKGQIQTGGSYDAHSGNGTRVVNDLHVPDALGQYGLDFTRYWNSTHADYDDPDAEWSTDFGQSGWSHSWKWNATYRAEVIEPEGWGEHIYNMSITITFPDGHTTKYKITRSSWWHGNNPPDPRLGPDYTPVEIDTSWPPGGIGVHDHLTKMAVNGSEFWLTRADGGSVHFVRATAQNANHGAYRATEVFDPHGLKTTLTYNPTSGLLERVEQEGGRYLTITWSLFEQGGSFITRVETGGPGAGSQYVTYQYRRQGGPFYVLTLVSYPNDPAPGQTAVAVYTYGSCWGEVTEGCAHSDAVPMLKRADDPRYAGAMTKIRYHYNGEGCGPILLYPWAYPEWVGVQPYAIAAEKSDAGDDVSSFGLGCDSGLRLEYNGLGGQRKFYFGNSAGTADLSNNFYCRGFQLGKVTDFTSAAAPIGEGTPCPPGVACRRQNYSQGTPRQIWDGRNYMTTEVSNGDASGLPSEIHHPDLSAEFYDRVNSSGSEALDTSRMHNPYTHWLFSKTDERGNVTKYTRDSRRRVTQVSYYNGPAQGNPVAVESFTYNEFNQVTSHTLPSGATQTYQYNALHQLVLEYNSVNEERKEYVYDGLGRVEIMRDTKAIAENASYTEKREYNGRHNITRIHYRPTGGSPDPTVTYEYDKYGNRTAIIDELGHRKDFTYDAYRRCTSSTEQVGSSANCNNVQVRRWDWIYDRVIEGDWVPTRPASAHTSKEWRIQIEPEFNDAHHRRATSRTFDVNNRILSEQTGLIQLPNAPLGTLQTVPDTETHRVTYDENGQKHSSTDSLGRVTTYGYDNRNRLETTTEPKRQDQQDYPVTRFQYDVAGNKTRVTFPDQKTQRWESYDAFGQAWEFFDERNNRTDLSYQWGPMKKLDTVRTYRQMDNNAGTETQVTDFDYDGMGRPTWTIFPDGSSELSDYALGRSSAFKTRKNQTKRLHYDARGREAYHTWDGGAAPRIDRVWDDANRLTRIWNNFSIIDYQYDDAGQVRTEGTTVTGDGVAREVRYCRYPNGEVSQITYPNGTAINRYYTPRGQLQSVGWGAGSTSYAYLPDGKVDYQSRSNGITTSYGYDGRGMIGLLRHSKDGHDLAKREYWRDDRDRILAWKRGSDNFHNGMEDATGDRYHYDDEGQLDLASYRVANPENTPGVPLRSDEFHYDALGNRMGSNRVASRGVMNFERDDNGLNQYGAWWPYSHIRHDDDVGGGWGSPGAANGVLMEDGYITAGFNALNQPVCMWSPMYPGGTSAPWMWFGYDPLGRCVKRWVAPYGAPSTNATYYYYDGWNLIQEGPGGGTVDRVYVHGGRVDEIVASWGNSQWYHHHYDARGHCIMLTGTNGSIQEQYDYDAFGLPYIYRADGSPVALKLGSPAGNRFLFTGREWIKDHRLYDYRNRMYQPELGRFLQPDPTGFEAGDYNLYRYCDNDPVNKSDPTGMISLTSLGGGDWDFFNGQVAMAQIALQQPAANQNSGVASGNVNDVTINQLRKQLVDTKDTTSQIVPTEEGPQVANAVSQVKVPKGGRSSGAFGYEPIGEERMDLRSDATRIVHAHTDEGKKTALPTGHDFKAVRDAGTKREMWFTSRYLARNGKDPMGVKGNYIILRSTGSHRLDIPRQQYRFDPRLSLPPLP